MEMPRRTRHSACSKVDCHCDSQVGMFYLRSGTRMIAASCSLRPVCSRLDNAKVNAPDTDSDELRASEAAAREVAEGWAAATAHVAALASAAFFAFTFQSSASALEKTAAARCDAE